MWQTIIPSVISATALIVVAIIETNSKKDRKKVEERAKRRAEESQLAMEFMDATCSLAVATGKAIRDGHTNGIMTEALAKAEEAQANYEAFVHRTTANAVSKI